ncbi:Asp23/Gls24 family envelope stress response protein [Nocardiopsis algeriensis]|uniref:Putative alkaline shock family protein YloU n=1 Tax=Nocardiopsis algeriensis TaxID=1478215 RepID=A0A841IU24_9ACTN|nr:putative alkaline shock family protein YloU [Nocardiopsis algeriensis]
MSDIRTEIRVPGAREAERNGTGLAGEDGHLRIADGVVAKIAGMAAGEIGGVHALGSGAAGSAGAVRGARPVPARGVGVEVGERQAAVDLDLVVEYGSSIQDVAAAVRRNVTDAVERMTGLEVTEINIRVCDIHLPGDGTAEDPGPDPGVR